MRPLVIVLILGQACASAGVPSTTTTTASPADTRATTTSLPAIEMEIDDCTTPQVTFSPLCETFSLIESWHVDGPIDPAILAEAALRGLAGFHTDLMEDPPRKLFCAIPDPAFDQLCEVLLGLVSKEAVPIGDAVESAVIEMVATGLDPFSYYVTPEQAASFRPNGVVGGVGILLDANDAAGSRCARVTTVCELKVVFVLEDNPGAEAGLETGDVIVSIDGQEVAGFGFVEAGAKIAGDERGTVELGIERDGMPLVIPIKRRVVSVPTVEVRSSTSGVGYIRIPDFESDIPDLVDQGLVSLGAEPYSTLVIDLRDNPGGLIDSAIAVASQFIDEGPILTEIDVDDPATYQALPGGLATGKRLIVLVNQGTASAAEITAAALRDEGGATIIGEPTFGKDAIQIVFDLDNGGQLYLAVARWVSPAGTSVGDIGLIPDMAVDLPASMRLEDLVATALEAAS